MFAPEHDTTFRFLLVDPDGESEQLVERLLISLADAPPFGALCCPAYLQTARNGPAALEIVESELRVGNTFAVAIIARQLEGAWDGIETTCRLWEFCPGLQVILLQAADTKDDWMMAREPLVHPENLLLLKRPCTPSVFEQALSLMAQKWAQFDEYCLRMQDMNVQLDQRALKLQATIQRLEREITERRSAEARFSAAFRASPCAMAIISLEDSRVLDANDNFFDLLGQHPHSILGRGLELYPTLDDAVTWAAARAVMPERKRGKRIECDFEPRPGDLRRVWLSAEPLELPGGAYVLLSVVEIGATAPAN